MCLYIIYYFFKYSNNNLSVVTQQFWLENLKCLQHVLRIYINHIKLSSTAQNISVFLCLQRFVSGEIHISTRQGRPKYFQKQTSSINNEVSLVFLNTFSLLHRLPVRFRQPARYLYKWHGEWGNIIQLNRMMGYNKNRNLIEYNTYIHKIGLVEIIQIKFIIHFYDF